MNVDFSGIDTIDEDVENEIKDASVISMGTEIAATDLENIGQLADQVISLSEYRAQLSEYLKARMSIASEFNRVGWRIGRLEIDFPHAGSLINLAKQPASTVQILGAEKGISRALKTKHDTPKYGLIYHEFNRANGARNLGRSREFWRRSVRWRQG